MKTSRRSFITNSILATAGISTGMNGILSARDKFPTRLQEPDKHIKNNNESFKISVFSKCLQWLGYEEMAKLVAGMGFDGIDLTVRPNGHVLPERVTEDLPRAAEFINKAGLKIFMITTAINNADDPVSEAVLKTANSLGIHHYRMDWLQYDEGTGIEENLQRIKEQMKKLAALNEKYSIHGEYQNHSGTSFGASVWDLYDVLKEINSPWTGSQFDIMHAVVEGANSWKTRLKLMKPFITSLDMKDFRWAKKEDKWSEEVVPIGEGMINFKEYLTLLKQYQIAAPISIHYEYPLGGAENGNKTTSMRKEEVMSLIQKDINTLKKLLSAAGLVN